MLRVFTCFSSCISFKKYGDFASVFAAKVIWTYMDDVNSSSGENWIEPLSSVISRQDYLMVLVIKKLLM